MATSAEDETVISKKQEKMFWYKVRLIDCNEDQRSEAEDLKTEVYEVLNKPPIRQNEDFYMAKNYMFLVSCDLILSDNLPT